MDVSTQARYDAWAKIVKAMAHPTRLCIVDELVRSEEKCVCELAEIAGAEMSTISKHLAILKDAGIIEDEKRGSQVFFRLLAPYMPRMFGWLQSVVSSDLRRRQRLLGED